jgi:hypothetical protein
MSLAELLPLSNRECGPCMNGRHHDCVSNMGTPCPCIEILEDGEQCSKNLPLDAEPPDEEDREFIPDVFEREAERYSPIEVDFAPVSTVKSEPAKIPPPRRLNLQRVLDEITDRKLLGPVALETYRTLWHIGPATAGEISKAFRPGVHKRLPELERMGVIRRIGRRRCDASGKSADLWDVTDQLPREPTKSLTKTHLLLSVGQTVEQAVANFAEPVGWKLKELVDMPQSPRYHWYRKVVMENGESFEAAGQRVPGGYVMTLWK